MSGLLAYGWKESVEQAFAALAIPGVEPARVIEEQRGILRVAVASGTLHAEIAGRLRQEGDRQPAVGDWVAVQLPRDEGNAVIRHVLERSSKISRKVAGKVMREQVLAANLDTVFLVTSCNEDFNLRRIERYLTMIWDSGARPVLLLNKADLADQAERLAAEAETAAPGVPVHTVSALTRGGLDLLEPYLASGHTVALLGSSGVGKSTIVNRLMGDDVQPVQGVREDDAKGRHTTTSRQLFLLPGGALLLDTPGLREFSLWRSDSGLGRTFSDVEQLAANCRYVDCVHDAEPDCAVQAALRAGKLPAERFESYRKLRRELEHLERKMDPEARANTKRRWKEIHKNVRQARKKGWLR